MSFLRRLVSFALVQIIIEVVVAVILVVLLQLVLKILPAMFLRSIGGTTLTNVLQACLIFGVLLMACRWLEHRPFSEIGVPGQYWGRQLLFGFLLGSGLMGSVIGGMALAGFYRITGIEPINANPLFLLFVSLLLFLAVAAEEELIFRGMIFRLLERTFGSWIAVILSALTFGAAHLANPNATLISTLAIMLTGGVILAALYLLTRSLWWVIGLHLGWNFFEGPIFGTQVSGSNTPALLHASITGPQVWTGGAFGPEAGLLAILIVGSAGLLICALAARQHRIMTPRWLHRTPQRAQPEAAGYVYRPVGQSFQFVTAQYETGRYESFRGCPIDRTAHVR